MKEVFNREGGEPPKSKTNSGPSKGAKKRQSPPPVSVRFTAEERAQLRRDSGDATLSAHIRWCALKKGGPRKNTPIKDKESIARVLGLLGESRIANNLNQIAKQAHDGSLLLDEETSTKIRAAYSYVRAMRRELMNALGLRERGGR